MKQKFLYILALLLCVSTFASSNERARNCRHACPQAAAAATQSVTGEVSEASADVAPLPVLRLLSI